MNEIWKELKGYEGRFEASNLGRIRMTKRRLRNGVMSEVNPPLILSIKDRKGNSKGYKYIEITISGKRKKFYVHYMILEAFVCPRPKGKQCSHKNGIRSDNRVENLEWATPKENNDMKKIHGTFLCGDKIKRTKWSDALVRQCIERVKNGERMAHVARSIGMNQSDFHKIIKGKKRKHLQDHSYMNAEKVVEFLR